MGVHRDLSRLIETLEADEDGQTDNDLIAEDLRALAGEAASIERYVRTLEGQVESLENEVARLSNEVDRWRLAWGPFGPRTPEGVRIFLEERDRVSAQVAEHEAQLRKELELECEHLRSQLRGTAAGVDGSHE